MASTTSFEDYQALLEKSDDQKNSSCAGNFAQMFCNHSVPQQADLLREHLNIKKRAQEAKEKRREIIEIHEHDYDDNDDVKSNSDMQSRASNSYNSVVEERKQLGINGSSTDSH